MSKKRTALLGWVFLIVLSACTSGQGTPAVSQPTQTVSLTATLSPPIREQAAPTQTASLPPNVTRPAPTPAPGSTPVPWWGTTLHTLDIEPKYFKRPTGIVVAPDGSLYVADSGNNRILHLDLSSHVLAAWGTFSDSIQGESAPPGTFNEPWGLALGPDGSVFVADTWHNRIQKFSSEGEFILAWGEGAVGNEPYGFFGPRDVIVHPNGFVFVTDTGNKRVVVYDQQGKYISAIGGEGDQPGQFKEPVGLAIDPEGSLYVADQWNHRVQVFSVAADGTLTPKTNWPVDAWKMDTQEVKAFLCVSQGHVFITDSEAGSVLEYSLTGERLNTYNINHTGYLNYGFVYGIASDPAQGLWVSDYAGGAGILVRIVPQP